MNTLSLYEIANEYRETAAKLAEMDLDEQTLADTLEGEAWPVEEKARAVAMVAVNLTATAEAYKAHAKKAAERAAAISRRAEWLEHYLLTCMESCGISEIKGDAISLTIRNNPQSVEIFDAAQIPESMLRHPEPPPPAPDKKKILDAMKAGEEIPGARIIRGKRLVIA